MPKAELRFAETEASVLLDAVRALAASIVLLEHWRNVFFVDFSQVVSHRAFWAPFYLLCSAGHQAVIIFFVLSGYLISGSVFRMFAKSRWSGRTYAVHRLVRLWIVIIPGLLLTAALDRGGLHLPRMPAQLLYAGVCNNHVLDNVRAHADWLTGLGNLFFLQGVLVPTFGSDGALWSMANEFWYYVLFPLALLSLQSSRRPGERLACGALFLSIALWLPHGLVLGFAIWLMGTLLVKAPPLRLTPAAGWLATGAYVVAFFAFARAPFLQHAWGDTLLGVLTFGFLWTLVSRRSRAEEESPATRTSRTFARFSFTVYVVHTPLLILLAALVLPPSRWQPDAAHLLAGVLLLGLVVAVCFGVAWLTEFRTDRLRSLIEQRLHLPNAA